MSTFPSFPQDHKMCPICNTNEDKECTLIGIDGTAEGGNEQATVVHTSCLSDAKNFRSARMAEGDSIIYIRCGEL